MQEQPSTDDDQAARLTQRTALGQLDPSAECNSVAPGCLTDSAHGRDQSGPVRTVFLRLYWVGH